MSVEDELRKMVSRRRDEVAGRLAMLQRERRECEARCEVLDAKILTTESELADWEARMR